MVQISGCGQLPDGLAYIVMEYLEESLGSRMEAAGRPAPPSPRPCASPARSPPPLAAARNRGSSTAISKPDNARDRPRSGSPAERAKVLDFGIAKVLASAQGQGAMRWNSRRRRITGMMVGTPLYMAGSAAARDHRRSGGCVLARVMPIFACCAAGRHAIGDGSGAVMAMRIYENRRHCGGSTGDPRKIWRGSCVALVKDPAQRPGMAGVRWPEQLELKTIRHRHHVDHRHRANHQPAVPRTAADADAGGHFGMGPNPSSRRWRSRRHRWTTAAAAALPLIVAATISAASLSAVACWPSCRCAIPIIIPVTVCAAGEVDDQQRAAGATAAAALDQSEIGRTPWNTTQPAANVADPHPAPRRLRHDRVVTLDQSANAFVQRPDPAAGLQRYAATTPPPPAGDAGPAAGPRRAKGRASPKGAVAVDSSPAPDKDQQSPNRLDARRASAKAKG